MKEIERMYSKLVNRLKITQNKLVNYYKHTQMMNQKEIDNYLIINGWAISTNIIFSL